MGSGGMDGFFAQCSFAVSLACYAAAAFGCLYALVAAYAARRFAAAANGAPEADAPAVTILKPLHGAEPELFANLRRFCLQDYPGPVQIVFGVSDRADPAIEVVREIVAAFPGHDLKLVINSRRHGSNRKISNLVNMVAEANHDVLVISDSDIVVDSAYLKDVVASLQQPGVGLVTCLYRGIATQDAGQGAGRGIWAKLSAAAIDYHFLPSVLVGLLLRLAAPCFGSTIAIRKETLAEIGGLQSVADQLADDYALGAAVRRAGFSIAIPAYIVGHQCTQSTAHGLLRHELRWARTIRSVDPAGFAGTVITHAWPLALLGLLLGGMTPLAVLVPTALVCRAALQMELDRAFHLRRGFYWWGPLRDLLSFAVFVASFFGRGVEWRGHRYGVQADNTLAYYGEVET
jgi:ceramide glucosyltransferase